MLCGKVLKTKSFPVASFKYVKYEFSYTDPPALSRALSTGTIADKIIKIKKSPKLFLYKHFVHIIQEMLLSSLQKTVMVFMPVTC